MNKTLLILRHELLHTIKRIGFIIMTLVVPLVVLLTIGIVQFISLTAKPPVQAVTTIGYVDDTGGFQQYTSQGNITLVPFDTRDGATKALVKGDISEFFVIPSNYASTGVLSRYTLQKQLIVPDATMTAIKNFIVSNLLAGKAPPATI